MNHRSFSALGVPFVGGLPKYPPRVFSPPALAATIWLRTESGATVFELPDLTLSCCYVAAAAHGWNPGIKGPWGVLFAPDTTIVAKEAARIAAALEKAAEHIPESHKAPAPEAFQPECQSIIPQYWASTPVGWQRELRCQKASVLKLAWFQRLGGFTIHAKNPAGR